MGLSASATPSILAIDDVHLSAGVATAGDITHFYTEVLGLDPLPAESSEDRLAFYGYPRSGPRLYVWLVEEPPNASQKCQLVVQIASLFQCEQLLIEEGIACEWSRGWSFHDRRLRVQDPGLNRVELVAYHGL